MVGETERMVTERVDNYLYAKGTGSAGATNKRLWEEQQQLEKAGDYLYLEITDTVPGYDLSDLRQRRQAEALLRGVTRPYLQ